MSTYESEQGVDPVRIETFRRLRRRWKVGELQEGADLNEVFFTDTAREARRR